MSQGDPAEPGPLERLKEFTAAQASKGNVSPKADVATAWSELVVEALRAAPGDLEPVLGLRGLRIPVLGRGLALAWPHLSADAQEWHSAIPEVGRLGARSFHSVEPLR